LFRLLLLISQHTSPGDVKDLKSLYAQSFALVTAANKDEDENNLRVPIKKEGFGGDNTAKPDQPQSTKHFLDLMNSPFQPPSIGNELQDCGMFQANDLEVDEQMPNLPEVEVMSASSPHPLPFYPILPPPHWPMPIYQGQGPPHPYFVYCNYGYAYPDDHSANSTPILHPKPPANHSSAQYGRRFDKPLLTSGDDQEFIREATDNDVICGRGGAINSHPGNMRFREFINEFKFQYLRESKQTKPKVAMRVLELVKQSNPPGRFLFKCPEGYLECSEDRAKEKGE